MLRTLVEPNIPIQSPLHVVDAHSASHNLKSWRFSGEPLPAGRGQRPGQQLPLGEELFGQGQSPERDRAAEGAEPLRLRQLRGGLSWQRPALTCRLFPALSIGHCHSSELPCVLLCKLFIVLVLASGKPCSHGTTQKLLCRSQTWCRFPSPVGLDYFRVCFADVSSRCHRIGCSLQSTADQAHPG